MKIKRIIGIVIVIVSLLSITVVMVNFNIELKVKEKLVENIIEQYNDKLEKEFKKVKEEIAKTKNIELDDIIISDAIKVYYLNEPDLVSSYYKVGNLSKLISTEYLWNIVVKDSIGDINSILKMKEDKNTGDFNLIGYSSNDTVAIDTTLNQKELIKSIKKSNITDISDFKYVMVPMYHINILYIQTHKEEYAIAFDSRPDLTGLEKRKIYKVKELIDILNKNFNTNSK